MKNKERKLVYWNLIIAISITLLLVWFSFSGILNESQNKRIGITGFAISDIDGSEVVFNCGNGACDSGENRQNCAIDCGSLLTQDFEHYLKFFQIRYDGSNNNPLAYEPLPKGKVEFIAGDPYDGIEQYIYVEIAGVHGHENWSRSRIENETIALNSEDIDKLYEGQTYISKDKVQRADIEKLYEELKVSDPGLYGEELNYGVLLNEAGEVILNGNRAINDSPLEYYQQGKTIVIPNGPMLSTPTRLHFNYNSPIVREYVIRYTLKKISQTRSNSAYIDNAFIQGRMYSENGCLNANLTHYISAGDWQESIERYTENSIKIWKEVKKRGNQLFGSEPKIILNGLTSQNPSSDFAFRIVTEGNNIDSIDGIMNENIYKQNPLRAEDMYYDGDAACNGYIYYTSRGYINWSLIFGNAGKKLLFGSEHETAVSGQDFSGVQVYGIWLIVHLLANDNTYFFINKNYRQQMQNYSIYYYPLGMPLEEPHKDGDTWYREFERGTIVFNTSFGKLDAIKFVEKTSQPPVQICQDYGYLCRASCFANETRVNYNCTTGVCCSPQTTEQTCAEQGGIICSADKICNGTLTSASDTNNCCLGNCVTQNIIVQQDKTCVEQNGKICNSTQYCTGAIGSASDGECCLGECVAGSGITECKAKGGSCKETCFTNETQLDYYCGAGICCGEEEKPEKKWFYGFLGGIIIAIIGVVSYIIYEVNRKKGYAVLVLGISIIFLVVIGSFVFVFNESRGQNVGITGMAVGSFSDGNCGNTICETGEDSENCAVDCFVKPKIKPDEVVLGDYAGELRDASGRVNISLMIERLKEAHIDIYAFLLWHHKKTDYEDFLLFLDAANEEDIDVYVYLVPPAENCTGVLPYECDFVSWARNLSSLSLEYSNLKGWIIDDFYDYSFFTRKYVANFTYEAYKINPNFAFYPIVYHRNFVGFKTFSDYTNFIDGIIFPFISYNTSFHPVCNHQSTAELNPQITLFNDLYSPGKRQQLLGRQLLIAQYPYDTHSNIGDYISFTAKISSLEDKNFSFAVLNRLHQINVSGYHFVQFLIDNEVLWEEDLGNVSEPLNDFNAFKYFDLSNYNENSDISLRVIEKKSVSNFPVDCLFSLPRASWVTNKQGAFSEKINVDTNLGLIVMIYASRHTSCGNVSSLDVYNQTVIVLDRAKKGDVAGAIQYSLPKGDISEGSKYDYVKTLYSLYPSICGTGICDIELNETCLNCQEDCGECPVEQTCSQAGFECVTSCNGTIMNYNCTDTSKRCCNQTSVIERSCTQRGGIVCQADKICNGTLTSAEDTDDCCLGNCVTQNIIIQQDKTCAEQNGKICNSTQYCTGAIGSASDGECCLGECIAGSGIEECKAKGGSCKEACLTNETQLDYYCGAGICCGEEEKPEKNWFYWFVGGIGAAIVGVVSYIIYEVNKKRGW